LIGSCYNWPQIESEIGQCKFRAESGEGQPVRIRGLDSLTAAQVQAELEAGGRFVFFEYCISLLVFTLRRRSDIFLLRAGERGLVRGLPYTLISLVLGWWGVPWGLVYTPGVLLINLGGGRDATEAARALLLASGGEPFPAPEEALRAQP
jgi:hypothetical protein